jgi:exodeoxyribonuclease VII small subunit
MAGADASTTPDPKKLSFEAALARLEEVVDRLEGGELELEAALASFEEGVRLTRHCAEQLGAAERRIEVLLQEGNEWVARPFAEAAEPNGGETGGVEAGSDDDQNSDPNSHPNSHNNTHNNSDENEETF